MSERETAREESVVDHRERLEQLASLENRLRGLRERECELEVECIMAEAALNRTGSEGPSERDVETAARVVLALEGKRALELELDAREGRVAEKTENARAAREALLAWISAPEEDSDHRLPPMVRNVLLGFCLAVLFAAFAIHLAFLILLAPMGAISALMWSGDDSGWRRVGAKRNFEAMGLAPPAVWEEGPVKDRIQAIGRGTGARVRTSERIRRAMRRLFRPSSSTRARRLQPRWRPQASRQRRWTRSSSRSCDCSVARTAPKASWTKQRWSSNS